MEELTFQENLLINNSREHLKIIQGNLRLANEELTKVYDELAKAKNYLANVQLESERIISESVKTISDINKTKSVQDKRGKILLEREIKQLEVDKAFQQKTLESIQELEDINREVVQIKSKHEIFIKSKEEEIGNLEDKIITLKKEIINNEKENKDKLRVKKEIENEIIRLSSEREEVKKALDGFKKDSSAKMSETTRLIHEEKAKIKNPLELIKREQEKLDILKRDLDIIRLRLSNQFRKQNPDKILPIELQDKNGKK